MKGIKYYGVHRSRPRWMHDSPSNENLVPNGIMLRDESASESHAKPKAGQIPSGSIVARPADCKYFLVVSGDAPVSLQAALVEPAEASTIITVNTVDGFAVGDSLSIGGSSYTIDAIDDGFKEITLATAVTANAGDLATLDSTKELSEFYLMINSITEPEEYSEGSVLRHQRMVYSNFLPDYDRQSSSFELSGDLETKLSNSYQLVKGVL